MHAQLWCIFEWIFVHQFCSQQSQAPVASSLQCLRQSSQGGGGGSVGLAQTLVLLRRIQRWLPVGTRSCVGSTEVRGSTGATQAWKWGCTNGFGLTARIVLSGTLHDLLLGLCYWLWSLVCCRGECEDKMFKVKCSTSTIHLHEFIFDFLWQIALFQKLCYLFHLGTSLFCVLCCSSKVCGQECKACLASIAWQVWQAYQAWQVWQACMAGTHGRHGKHGRQGRHGLRRPKP